MAINWPRNAGICEQRWPRLAFDPVQSDQDLQGPLTESLDTTECMNGEKGPGETLHAHAQDDLNLRISLTFECTFSLDATQ